MLSKEVVRTIQILLGLFFCGALFMVFMGISNGLKLKQLEDEGVVVMGEILNFGELEREKGLKTHFLYVEFQKRDGKMVQEKFTMTSADYEKAIVIDTIPITYVPHKPGLSRVGNSYGNNQLPLFYAIVGSFFGLIFIIVLEIIYRKKANNQD